MKMINTEVKMSMELPQSVIRVEGGKVAAWRRALVELLPSRS